MENANQNNARLEVIKASEIEPKEIEWLWYPFIPYGKVTLLQGDPGDGKSTFMLTIAALLTRGEPLPFTETGKPPAPISVIYQTTEDDADDTIVPRFIKANGDRERLLFISEKESPLTFDDGRILSAIRETGARVLILDPLSSYIGDCQINAANEVRPRFNCLIRIAKETGCAIVIINHLNKMFGTKAIYRTPGSIDIVGAVRSALLIGRNGDNEDERILVQQKANLAPTGMAIVFSVGEDGIRFIEQTEKTADELLSMLPQKSGGRPKAALGGPYQQAPRTAERGIQEQPRHRPGAHRPELPHRPAPRPLPGSGAGPYRTGRGTTAQGQRGASGLLCGRHS